MPSYIKPVCHHGGFPPKPRFSQLSNLELLYFHGGEALGRAIKVKKRDGKHTLRV